MRCKIMFIIKLLVFYTFSTIAQKPISLKDATELALKNNHQVRSDEIAIQYQKAMVNSAYSLPMTTFSSELGQFNSSYFDAGFAVNQSFSLPKVYKYKQELYKSNVLNFEYLKKMTEQELRKNLEYIYLQHAYLQEKKQILKRQNEVYRLMVDKATIRQNLGESNVLEKSSALQQNIKIEQQINLIDKEIEVVLLELNLLINDGELYEPSISDWDILPYLVNTDNKSLETHPRLKQAQQEIDMAQWNLKSQKTALLPEFSIGYTNIGIQGIGADDVFYKPTQRFHAVQVGINIPLYQKGIKSAIKASEFLPISKQWNYESQRAKLNMEKDQKMVMYMEYVQIINQYKNEVMPSVELIRTTAQRQYQNGEINYLELVLLNNQVFSAEADYLEMTKALNTLIIDLFYLTNQF
jgi:heavy metal efflux system protein